MIRIILSLSVLLAAASVTMAATAQSPGQSPAPSPAASAADDESRLPLNEFMGHVLQRNAEQLWVWSAYIIDEKGEHSGRPVTDQQWEEAESDALTIQQLTYTLQHSTIRIDDPRWDRHLEGLRAAATASADAAEHKDYDALERAGEEINDQCIACHLTFAPDLETPPPT